MPAKGQGGARGQPAAGRSGGDADAVWKRRISMANGTPPPGRRQRGSTCRNNASEARESSGPGRQGHENRFSSRSRPALPAEIPGGSPPPLLPRSPGGARRHSSSHPGAPPSAGGTGPKARARMKRIAEQDAEPKKMHNPLVPEGFCLPDVCSSFSRRQDGLHAQDATSIIIGAVRIGNETTALLVRQNQTRLRRCTPVPLRRPSRANRRRRSR